MSPPSRPRVVVAGASGFIGTAVYRALAARHEVVALTRSPARACTPDPEGHIAWRQCDLFSARAVAASLEGADFAMYLFQRPCSGDATPWPPSTTINRRCPGFCTA